MMRLSIKYILIALAVLFRTFSMTAGEVSIPASDGRITWTGRTLAARDGSVSFDWSATCARISFSGSSLVMEASDSGKDYFNVWIDRPMSAEPDRVICLEGSTSRTVLADESLFRQMYGRKSAREHSVIIQKRTEGSQGRVTVRSFACNGSFIQAEGPGERSIEFIGDSFTCGYGTENSIGADPFRAEDENCAKTYAAIVSRYFDADFVTLCHSGQGVCRNYDDAQPQENMVIRYGRTFDCGKEPAWDAGKSTFSPDISVVFLGTNDFSVGKQPTYASFKQNYSTLISAIKANYGDSHPILCVAPSADSGLLDYVRRFVQECGLPDVHVFAYFDGIYGYNGDELGASLHPNYKAQRKLACAIIPYISTLTGWEMQSKAIE